MSTHTDPAMRDPEFGEEAKGWGRLVGAGVGILAALVMGAAFAPMLLRTAYAAFRALMAMW